MRRICESKFLGRTFPHLGGRIFSLEALLPEDLVTAALGAGQQPGAGAFCSTLVEFTGEQGRPKLPYDLKQRQLRSCLWFR